VRCGRMGPQFRPILQSQRPDWGWAGQQASSGDEGVGATVGDGSGDGSALVRGEPPTPPSARASTAAPPHAAAIFLPIRFAMKFNFRFCAPNVQGPDAARCRVGACAHYPEIAQI
jgi:hypothetical protein